METRPTDYQYVVRFDTSRQFKEVNTNAIHAERSKGEIGTDNGKESDSATPDHGDRKTATSHP